MYRNIVIGIFFCVYVFAIPNIGWGQDYFYYTYNTRGGLPSNKVKAVVQDMDGNIWIPSDKGVTKFNGKRFKTFTVKNGLPTNETFFTTAIDDKVWVYDYTPNMTYIRRDTVFNTIIPKHRTVEEKGIFRKRYFIKKDSVTMNINSDNTSLMIEVNDSCYSIDFGKFIDSTPKLKEKIPLKFFKYYHSKSGLITSTDGRLLAVAFDTTLIIYNLRTKEIISLNTNYIDKNDNASGEVYPHLFSNHFIYMSDTPYILWFIDLNDFTKKSINLKEYDQYYTGSITHLFKSDKEFCITSLSNMYMLFNEDLELVDTFRWDIDKKINNINRDNSGNYWIASNNEGIQVVTKHFLKFKKIKHSISTSNILNIYSAPEGFFLFDDESNLFICDKNFKLTKKIKLPVIFLSYPEIKRYWVYPDEKGGFYITSAFGVYYLDKSRSLHSFEYQKISSHKNYIYNKVKDTLTIATSAGLYYANSKGKTVQSYDTSVVVRINNISESKNGYWCTNDAGRIVFMDIRCNILEDTLIDKRIVFSTIINDNLIIALDGYGVYRFDTNTRELELVIKDDNFNYYLRSDDGFWLANQSYIVRYNNKLELAAKYLNTKGLLYNELYNINECEDGDYLLCDNGIVKLPDSTFTYNDTVFQKSVYVSSVSIGNTSYYFNREDSVFTCQYLPVNYTIEFSCNSTSYLGEVGYEYYIEDDKNQWLKTSNNFLSFATLSPGEYKIHVKAVVDNIDVNSDEKVFKLVVAPLWWQSIYFKAAMVLLGTLLIIVSILVRLKVIKKRERKRTELNKKIAELELSALQSQMNPHFIFNTLTSIQSFINTESIAAADDLLHKFSLLVRKYLEFSRRGLISIQEEIDTLKLYTQIEQIRFNNVFDVRYIIRNNSLKKMEEVLIPPILLQPLVENAINHGLYHLSERRGLLRIALLINNTNIKVIIDDNGVGRSRAKSYRKKIFKSVGNNLIQDRVAILNESGRAEVSVNVIDKTNSDKEPIGTRVVLTIKI